jgi:type I restriction-modification system DNA methylase subunit
MQPNPTMQKNNINPAIYQEFLSSASNAGDKGQAQYFTPIPWGKALGMALPYFRPVVIDLNCGAGHLLKAVERGSTNNLLG